MNKPLCTSHGSEKKRVSSETCILLEVNTGKNLSACPALWEVRLERTFTSFTDLKTYLTSEKGSQGERWISWFTISWKIPPLLVLCQNLKCCSDSSQKGVGIWMEIKGKIKKRSLNLYLIQWFYYLKLSTSRSSADFSFSERIEPCVTVTNASGKYSCCVTLMLQWKSTNWIRYKRYDFLHLWCMWIMEAMMTYESGSYVSQLLKSRFWNDTLGTAAAECTGLWGVQCDYQ